MSRFVVVSGCSGGGKSAVLAELARRGHPAVQEPGRRIVVEQLATGGVALPWDNPAAFARRAIEIALADLDAIARAGAVGFLRPRFGRRRSRAMSRAPGAELPGSAELRSYHRQVFMTPPWPDIYVSDAERRHTLDDAVAEYERLIDTYRSLGYETTIVPKLSIEERAELRA